MYNDILSQYLGDNDFLAFALEYNNLTADLSKRRCNDLWIVLDTLQGTPWDSKALQYLFSVEDFTHILLDTLKNYRSHDIFERVLTVLSPESLAHQLWNVDVYASPDAFTSIFYGNCPHGLQSLSVVGSAVSDILLDRKDMQVGTALGVNYYVHTQTWWLMVEVRIWSTKPHTDDEKYIHFFPSKVLYTVTLDRNATLEYLEYKYPGKNFFEIFDVPFSKVVTMKYDA